MSEFSLVPVDHQPEFSDVSLVPVDHDPFSADGMIQQARTQWESQPQPSATGAVPSDIGAQLSEGNKMTDIARGGITSAPKLARSVARSDDDSSQIGVQLPEFTDGSSVYSYASLAPSLNDDPKADVPFWPGSSKTGSNQQQFSMASRTAHSRCVDKCLHLLTSPSGDLQSSEFRLCVAQCMGRL